MAKPKTRREVCLNRQLEALEANITDPADAKFKREQKKLLKKARRKHTRNVQRRELRDMVDE